MNKKPTVNKICLNCKETFHPYPSVVIKGKARFCSRKCADKMRLSIEARQKIRNTLKGRVGSRKGKKTPGFYNQTTFVKNDKRLIGENNPNWKGGVYLENKAARQSWEYRQWRKFIKERDDFTCQICGDRGGFLHSNHIKKFADYLDLRTELLNGITICKNCDNRWVKHHEEDWESYFNFNLMTRGFLNE